MKHKEAGAWSPYVAGALSGILTVASVYVAGKYLGASTTFARSAGMVERLFIPARVASLEYFRKEVPVIDWQWMFVVGILFGAFLSAVTSDSFRLKAIPDMWEHRFGASRLKRGVAAFLGGIVAMFGARLADG